MIFCFSSASKIPRMYILWLISRKEDYCYNIAKKITKNKKNHALINTNLVKVHLVLKYLEHKGLVNSKNVLGENNKKRVIYSITRNGKKELSEFKKLIQKENREYIRYLSK
ncbi:MAG: PadR family transcriptional regulator [Candidatus Micrarchaeia archaeon]|jgi:DNA-binding PadR family transcriptional regulator